MELGLDQTGDGPAYNRYTRAAATETWLNEGILKRDARPAVYYHTIEYAPPHSAPDAPKKVLRGFLALAKLEALDSGHIYPHENTRAAAKTDRLNLIEACRSNQRNLCDNPIFLPEYKLTLTGANFQGSPVALPMDMVGAAVTMVSVLSERRLNRLTNPALSVGLPAFLTKGAGMFSGMMLSQYTADMMIVEQRILPMPASIQSIPASADQEDFVSMGMNTALKTLQILDNAYGVLGIEFMAGAQGLDFRTFAPGKGVAAARSVIRRHVAHLDEDRPLHADHNTPYR